MAVVETHPTPIAGPWVDGYVLERHVVSSTPIGQIGPYTQFDTIRSALGELVFQLKNRNGAPGDIIDTAAAFVRGRWLNKVDCVVWPPPSVARARQPAELIARGICEAVGLQALAGAVKKTAPTEPMKNVPTHERAERLRNAYQAGLTSVAGMRVLIVDDLWQTGTTMRSVAEVLLSAAAREVRALAMTRTKRG